MEDKELLLLAVLAVGLWQDNGKNPNGWGCNYPIGWNPLADNADAFHLMTKANIKVTPPKHPGDGWVANDVTSFNDDPELAMRRAIVIAAARIGEKLRGE